MAITMRDPLSFENLACGAADEKFDDVIEKILANILNPNTRP